MTKKDLINELPVELIVRGTARDLVCLMAVLTCHQSGVQPNCKAIDTKILEAFVDSDLQEAVHSLLHAMGKKLSNMYEGQEDMKPLSYTIESDNVKGTWDEEQRVQLPRTLLN